MSKTIRQTITFKVGPHEVYEALMDEKKHADFTGGNAKVSRKVGGKFAVWGGEIEGENLELEPDHRIVQAWRSADWEKGYYSKATFTFEKVDKGTRLTFTQTGVPPEHYDEIKQGWKDYYWEPMKEMFGR